MIAAARAADLLAGLSLAGLLIPEGVAYSGLAGLPPQAGAIALLVGLVCYGLIGRSRYAIVTATSSSAAVLAAATLSLSGNDAAQRVAMASVLVISTGIAFALAGCARLGSLSNLIARPVLRGYAFGLAFIITVKQFSQLVGIHPASTSLLPLLLELSRDAHAWMSVSLLVGAAALLVLFLLQRLRHIPGAVVVIAAGIVVSPWLALHGVALIGPIHFSAAATRIAWPGRGQWLPLVEFALALMFILFAESWSSIRTYALKHDDGVQPNRDLLALGVANVISGTLHGTPVGAGYSATSANEAAGAQSRRAGLYAAAVILVLLLLLLRWIERIPQPVLAAIVIYAVSGSLRWQVFRPYFRWQRDRTLALTALAAVLVLGVLQGLLAAIAVSVAILLRSLVSPRLSILGRLGLHDFVNRARFPEAASVCGMLILRPEEPMFFANADALLLRARTEVQQRPDTKVLVLSLEESPDLDSTSLESLGEFGAWLERRGVELRVARLKDASREALLRAKLAQLPASALDYSSVDDAVSGGPGYAQR